MDIFSDAEAEPRSPTGPSNRIREMRRRRGMTLKEVADAIRPEPTTPQTIGRLEKGVRTVSIDWLAKIAEVLDCHVADLIETPTSLDIPLVGAAMPDGHVHVGADTRIEMRPPAHSPVAVRLSEAAGVYRSGDTVICNRTDGPDLSSGLGRDCLVRTVSGETLFGRLTLGREDGTYTLAPLRPGATIRYDLRLEWAAAAVTLIRSLS
jgi:transcriptional regulator with XRE-family HTH domain